MINIGFSFDIFIKDYINVFDIFVSYGFNPYFITSLSNKDLINKEKEIYEKQTVFYHPTIIKQQPEQLVKSLLDNKIFIILTSLPEIFYISLSASPRNQSKHNFSILYFNPETSLTDKIIFSESPMSEVPKNTPKGTLSSNEIYQKYLDSIFQDNSLINVSRKLFLLNKRISLLNEDSEIRQINIPILIDDKEIDKIY